MDSSTPAKKKLPWLKLAAVAVVLGVAALLVLRGFPVKAWLEQGMDKIRSAGPGVFFAALAILPAFGAPTLAWSLSAGALFGESLGTGRLLAVFLAAMTFNFIFAYFLAQRALRPVLEKLMTRLGYKLPEVESGDAGDLLLILRLTPGVPFFVQNYMAGLAKVPFGKYVWLSLLIVWPMNAGFVLFGDALIKGKGGMIVAAVSVIIAAAAGMHLVRRHMAKKQRTK